MTTWSRSRPFCTVCMRAVEHDLERGELLVDVVLGLVAELAGRRPRRRRRSRLRDAAGLADDLGALHHPLGLDPARLDDVVGLAAGLGEELLALLEQPAGVAQLLGERRERLLEQLERTPRG